MALNATRASTPDGSGGLQVSTITPEDGTAGIVQAAVLVGLKTTYAEASRTAITALDSPTGGNLTATGFAGTSGANLFDLENCLAVQVRATCSTASATLTGRLVFYDGSNNAIGFSDPASAPMSFTSDATLRLGNGSGDFLCAVLLRDAGAARKAEFLVSSVSAGTWAIYCRPI